MKIETTYTIDHVKNVSCYWDLEITSETGEKVIARMPPSMKKQVGESLIRRAEEEMKREKERLTEELEPTEEV